MDTTKSLSASLAHSVQSLFHSSDNGSPADSLPQASPAHASSDESDKTTDSQTLSPRKLTTGKTTNKPSPSKASAAKSRSSGPRRMFSLSRSKTVPVPSQSVESQTPSVAVTHEDSPFVRPSSPESAASLPSFGSMRVGTQTLIQALTAMPWTEDADNDDDILTHDTDPTSGQESDDDDRFETPMASSIHTIYRPVARSRHTRGSASHLSSIHQLPRMPETDEDPHDATALSEEEMEDDFEPTNSGAHAPHEASNTSPPVSPAQIKRLDGRFGSLNTVRFKRRARLADKLRDIFELNGIHEVIAEMPCWLLRSVLLQGYLYLTDSYLCFFAHMPSREDQVLKSGWMMKKAQRTKRWIKHWFTLKNDVLSWYHSSTDPYFPHGVVDLRYVISCDPVDDKGIRLRTNQKSIRLSADSIPSRNEWVKAIRRVILKAQNMGDSVKIAIPYSSILDVENSSALDFSETIEVKVVDKNDNFSMVDSYFFAYFQDLSAALDQIRDTVRSYRPAADDSSNAQLIDTTIPRSSQPSPGLVPERINTDQTPRTSSSGFKFPSLWRPFSEATPNRPAAAESIENTEDFTHINRRKSTFVPFTSEPLSMSSEPGNSAPPIESPESELSASNLSNSDHTYPPAIPPIYHNQNYMSHWGKPSWLKMPSRRTFSLTSLAGPDSASVTGALSSVLSSAGNKLTPDAGFSIHEVPGGQLDMELQEKFRAAFAFDDKEQLLGYFPGYLLRLLPIFGKLYISNNYFCFKSSSGPLTPRIKMILPIRDVLATENCRAFHISYHGLVVIIRGYEELFFSFAAEDRRASFVHLLETQTENVLKRASVVEGQAPSKGQLDALFLEEIAPRASSSSDSDPQDKASDALPSHMFTSTSSTFLTFKPSKPLHFTCLTIGSRGDVQPYIALAKGLIADGHRVRIATHGEFKEWIESQGIEFAYVGGDPAELMRICVENGMFTVSFLKEGITKFRGWIDDLLKTSWEACQNTDVLIESPSAMGGFHIAEALGIPYFRAFTMTWSRTRAYPHAFAVPERKLGGNYNYMSYVLFDQVFWRGISGQVNRWRRNTLGLQSTNLDKMEPHNIPFIYNFSPVAVPPPLDWPEWIRVTGYWFLDDANVSATKWIPPPDLVQFLETARSLNKKVVYIGFGSIVVSDPKAMTRCVVDAIVQSDVYAILSKGWSDRLQVKTTADSAEPEIALPKQIYPIASIPHDWLFKRIDAACHHGGAGTTGASLRAGIPTIIRPFFGDQYFWADRVEALGIGSAVRKLTVENLSDALISATTDRKQIQRAKHVGEQIRAENGVSTAIEAIYRDLEYARSLTLKRRGTLVSPHEDGQDSEKGTIRMPQSAPQPLSQSPERSSTASSSGSATGAVSEDWSVVSDQEDSRSLSSSRHSEQSPPSKRRSLSAAVLAVLPEQFSPASSRTASR